MVQGFSATMTSSTDGSRESTLRSASIWPGLPACSTSSPKSFSSPIIGCETMQNKWTASQTTQTCPDSSPAHLRTGTFISRSYSSDDLRAHIVVGCVDTRAARATIRDAVGKWSTVSYWLDLGNNADSGQFILGEPLNERNRRAKLRLRTAVELYSEIVDPSLDNDGEPSCSAVESLERQEPFVNQVLAQHALALMARVFRYGEISYHGGFVNLATGATSVLRIDPQGWRRTRRLSEHNPTVRRGQED